MNWLKQAWWRYWWKFVYIVAGHELQKAQKTIDQHDLDYTRLQNAHRALQLQYGALNDELNRRIVGAECINDGTVYFLDPDRGPLVVGTEGNTPLEVPMTIDTTSGPDISVFATLDPGPTPPLPADHPSLLLERASLLEYLLVRILDETRGHEFQTRLSERQATDERMEARGTRLVINRDEANDVVTIKLERV